MILKTYDVNNIDHLITPLESFEITLDSPALDIFTDFQKTDPLVIEDSLDVVTAEDLMKKNTCSFETGVKWRRVCRNAGLW